MVEYYGLLFAINVQTWIKILQFGASFQFFIENRNFQSGSFLVTGRLCLVAKLVLALGEFLKKSIARVLLNLTHYCPLLLSYTPWKHQKTFLMTLGGIEVN